MESKNERTPAEQPRAAEQPQSTQQPPASKKRFRIEKVEERIVPRRGGGSAGSSPYPVSVAY